MKNITQNFGHLYHPVKTLVVFKKQGNENDCYVESYDMDNAGRPINGHPLSVKECHALAKALTMNLKKGQGFLIPEGLLPKNVLHIDSQTDGSVIWHTPAQSQQLLFLSSLNIPCGIAGVPALLWKAKKGSLQIFALPDEAVSLQTVLHKAPFFNLYTDGRVCMGNVRTSIPANCCLEKFIQLWEYHFFNSYFSHTIHGESPVKGNLIQLWQQLLKTGEAFPAELLTPSKYQLKHLLP